jgi:hypothetical protein
MFREFFGNRLISKIVWTSHSRDLTPPLVVFYRLKERVYKGNPRKLNDLKKAISQAIKDITPTILRLLSGSVGNHVQLCLQENGGHLQ